MQSATTLSRCGTLAASALRFVTLRRLRDARLPCDSGSKQVCFAAPRFFVLAPVHPRCSARLRAS